MAGGSPQTLNVKPRPQLFAQSESAERLNAFWDTIRANHQSQTIDARSLSLSRMSYLPAHWTVVHISVSFDQSTLFVSRQRGQDTEHPLVFCIPLKGRREGSGDDDEHLTFDDALHELNEIVRLSNETTKVAVKIKDQLARAEWWKERRALDVRLRELLENIEFCWLGAFKVGKPLR
jgi:separase